MGMDRYRMSESVRPYLPLIVPQSVPVLKIFYVILHVQHYLVREQPLFKEAKGHGIRHLAYHCPPL